MSFDLRKTLIDLVSTPSVNPMGRAVDGPEFYEGKLTDYLESVFRQLGLTFERQNVEANRDNIVARLEGQRSPNEGGELILFEVHQDTVPVDGMTIAPWGAEIRDGKLYGRGACDVKGSMAAMLSALARLARERPAAMPTIALACTVNEEHGFTGASALVEQWTRRRPDPASIIPRCPDACIVAEPTRLDVVVAHKGVVRWKCHTTGRAAHSSQPESGENAIYKMGRVVGALEQYARDVVPHLAEDALCGRPTLSVGTIMGGMSVNTVPERCTIEIDRRLIPTERPEDARRHIVEHVGNAVGFDVEHDPPYIASPGLTSGPNDVLAQRLQELCAARGLESRRLGVPYGTDAAAIGSIGEVPTVVFGPGSIEQAHTADEWIDLDQVHTAADLYYDFARYGLTLESRL